PDFVSEMMAMEAAPFVSSTMAMADVMAMDVADGYGATGVFNVAFFGDSITDWEDSFVDALVGMVGSDITLNNFAAGGAGITPASGVPLQDRDNLTELIASVPELVWIMIGGNDILGGATAADYETALDAFVAQLSGLENAPNIVIAAQPPFFAVPLEETGGTPGTVVHQTFRDEWIPAMQRVAANYGATFFDLNSQVTDYPENYPDTLHPNAAGAQSLANLIAPELLSALPAEPFAGGTLPAPGRPAEEEDRDLDDEDDEDDEVFDDENEEEVPDGYTATLVPSRITLDLDGSGPQGLYFAQQAPDFVPIPVGSELAQYLPAEIVGLTNAELQALYGASFSGFVLPSDARSIPEVSGGFIAAAPPAFETFPFPLDPRFDLGGGGMDDDGVEVSEADAAMLARFYIVFYGRMPDEGGFENWITAMEADPTLDENGLARAFAEAEEFQILYGGLAPGDLVQALYQNALNRAPDPEGGAFWEGVLIEDPTLGAMDLALAFVMAEETQALYAEAIDAFLHGEDGMAMEDGEDEDVGEPEEAVIVATSAAEVFQVTEETPFLVIDGFDPSLDRLDLSALSTSFDAIELESTEAGTYMAVNDLEVLLEGVAASSIGADVLIF
ncbi:MAG: GDSL-type esterase/lipase family protein, partial [Pseudomonadota bacterium]